MSAAGQKRGFDRAQSSSGLPRRTDIIRPPRQVRLVPEVGLIYLMPRWQGFLNVVLDWGYYVRAIRDLTHPPSWRWRIIRRGNPMGVLLEAGGFSTYEAARFAGNVALADFLEQLEREKLRND